MAIKAPPGIKQASLEEAEEIPGVREFFRLGEGKDRRHLYTGRKGRSVSWNVVGPFLLEWWRKQERGRSLAMIQRIESISAELAEMRAALEKWQPPSSSEPGPSGAAQQ